MKTVVALICCFAASLLQGADGRPRASVEPRRLAELVRQSSYATIEQYESKEAPISVKDRAWMEAFAKVLEGASYAPTLPVFAVGPRISFRGEQGRAILSLELLGGILRLQEGDYSVGEKTGTEIGALIARKGG